MIPLKEAQRWRVCRICEQPMSAKVGDSFILNYGEEYAHESCLKRMNETPTQTTAIAIRQQCDRIADMLIKKNASYGDSALSPVRIFSRSDAIEAIKVRIDDKLSRLMKGNGEDFKEDTIDDLMGYLVLLKIAYARAVKNEYAANRTVSDGMGTVDMNAEWDARTGNPQLPKA